MSNGLKSVLRGVIQTGERERVWRAVAPGAGEGINPILWDSSLAELSTGSKFALTVLAIWRGSRRRRRGRWR
jgi:hypothetical protein